MDKLLTPLDKAMARLSHLMATRPRMMAGTVITVLIIVAFGWSHSNNIKSNNPVTLADSQITTTVIELPASNQTATTNEPEGNNTNVAASVGAAAANATANTNAAVDVTTSVENQTPSAVPEHTPTIQIPHDTPPNNTVELKTGNWQTIKIRKNDNLSRIFFRNKIKKADLAAIMALGANTEILKELQPGEKLKVLVNRRRQLIQLTYTNRDQITVVVTRTDGGFQSATIDHNNNEKRAIANPEIAPPTDAPAHIREVSLPNNLKYTAIVVTHSLHDAVKKTGLSKRLARQLVQLYENNPHYIKELKAGDKLAVLYETGKENANILVAEFTSHGKPLRLVRFTDPSGYSDFYTPQGYSLKPAILRAPLSYKRISSYFSKHRWQPVLHFMRPHQGVDYAAAMGTPIKAAGDGTLAYVGPKGGYGNTIVIKHGSGYTTLYAHMSRFAKDSRAGKGVEQGQVIGYVGDTGTATGAHLHYEIRIKNIPQNPLTVLLPIGRPLPKAYREEFFNQTQPLLSEFAAIAFPKFAMLLIKHHS